MGAASHRLHRTVFPFLPSKGAQAFVEIGNRRHTAFPQSRHARVVVCSLVLSASISSMRREPQGAAACYAPHPRLPFCQSPFAAPSSASQTRPALIDFARILSSFGVELISTGGTARALREAGLTVQDISDLTGFPEMLDGRVKNPASPSSTAACSTSAVTPSTKPPSPHTVFSPSTWSSVNLYAFEKTAAQSGVRLRPPHRKHRGDNGGPSMVRSAAKNLRRRRHRHPSL